MNLKEIQSFCLKVFVRQEEEIYRLAINTHTVWRTSRHSSNFLNWVVAFPFVHDKTVTVPWLDHKNLVLACGKHYAEKISVRKKRAFN